ncbi:ATP-binding protein [Crocosphaera sp. Alani8]|uniref:ATP-binding protein n=1 Tax=Crocosphaera sp. Alani8 TaxID=3038952 RepID=UPI00313DBC36
MLALSLPQTKRYGCTISFTSTLYLCPVLDLLLEKIPNELQAELRLGLQEALVNAAKHGNKLDPGKSIFVKFSVTQDFYSWIISDQGQGFSTQCDCTNHSIETLPPDESENGRGFCLLYEIFDQVHWDQQKTQLKLCKQVKKNKRQLIFSNMYS